MFAGPGRFFSISRLISYNVQVLVICLAIFTLNFIRSNLDFILFVLFHLQFVFSLPHFRIRRLMELLTPNDDRRLIYTVKWG